MAFQNSALYPNTTVAENIGFPMLLAKLPTATIAKRVSEVAEVLNLSDVLNRYPGRLSGGQQQRVALGRAIIRAPRLLLMDEPMSNLDAKLRAETRTVERVGERLHVYATLDAPGVTQSNADVEIDGGRTSTVIVLMSTGSSVNLWQPLDLTFDLSQMHLFDPQTGETLAQTSAGRSSVSA